VLAGVAGRTALGRLGEAGDIAQSIIALHAMEWVTGQVLDATAGCRCTARSTLERADDIDGFNALPTPVQFYSDSKYCCSAGEFHELRPTRSFRSGLLDCSHLDLS